MELTRCCIHSITNKPWKLDQAVDKYAEAGIGGISVWQSSLEGIGAKKAASHIKASGLEVVSYVRGGFFAHPDGEEREKAIENNKRQLEEAAEARCTVDRVGMRGFAGSVARGFARADQGWYRGAVAYGRGTEYQTGY